jgi:hypothetical protein
MEYENGKQRIAYVDGRCARCPGRQVDIQSDHGHRLQRYNAADRERHASTAAWVPIDAFDVAPLLPAPTVARVQETGPSIAFTTDWTQAGISNLWSGENARQSVTAGGRATLTFTGTSVRWIGERGFGTGLANVSIDGQFIARVDTNTFVQEGYQAVLFSASGLTAGTHTLTIEIVGRTTKPPVQRSSGW